MVTNINFLLTIYAYVVNWELVTRLNQMITDKKMLWSFIKLFKGLSIHENGHRKRIFFIKRSAESSFFKTPFSALREDGRSFFQNKYVVVLDIPIKCADSWHRFQFLLRFRVDGHKWFKNGTWLFWKRRKKSPFLNKNGHVWTKPKLFFAWTLL